LQGCGFIHRENNMHFLNIPDNRSWRFRAILFAALAVILVWEVISRSFVAYLADIAPDAALLIRSHQPTANLNLAGEMLLADQEGKGATPSDQATPSDAGSKIALGSSSLTQAFEAFEAGSQSASKETSRSSGAGEPSRPAVSDAALSERIRKLAEVTLRDDPFNARALRILGQLADDAKDEARALRFMQASARLSIQESYAVYSMMRKSSEMQDYTAAMYYADVLLRTRPQFTTYAMPTLVQIAENKDESGALKKVLSENPPWRAGFFGLLPNSVTDARTPLELLLAVRDTPTPPIATELRGYLTFLIERKFYALAYYTWLQFLPPEQLNNIGLLFNGSFDISPSGLPFDWLITPGAGVTIDIAAAPDQDGQHALLVAFEGGRVDFHSVTEMILLAPGTYQFSGKYKGEMVAQRGLKWRVVCAGAAIAPIGESVMLTGMTSMWKDTEFSFTVPGADCPAQYLRLDFDARMASEQFVSGSIWFNQLRIAHVAEPPTK
jgi:hypothetical protein